MAISLEKRGDIWHARGTVRVGRETFHVARFSTGCTSRADAAAIAEAEAARIRTAALEGDTGRARRLTIAECLAASLDRPGGLPGYEIARIAALNDAIGGRPIGEAAAAWRAWLALHPAHALATLQRARNSLAAALRIGAEAAGLPIPILPKLPPARSTNREIILSPSARAALLRSYNPSAGAPALLLADQGLRTQEALRLDWRDIRLDRETIIIRASNAKSGKARAVPMTRRVALLLVGLWHAAGRPELGPVFLSSRGAPYADTRGREPEEGEKARQQGGNPLAQAHITACRRAGVRGFRVHDWRHDWAARQIEGGMDIFTLCKLGGWSSLAMVQQRYGAISAEHLRASVRRIA